MEENTKENTSNEEEGCCLLSVKDTSPLLSPIASAPRIRYTCITCSPHYIAVGANTGGVYCFHRHDYHYIRILANQEGSVSLLKISPSESSLAVCNGGGHVSLWELNLPHQGISRRVHVSSLLKDAAVIDMVWDNKATRLFFGDDQGRLAVSYMPKKKFKKPDEVMHQEKPIVQMDLYQDLLLVSTVTRCILLNVNSHEVVQVGKRPRDGAFGACFHLRWPNKPPVIYSARPGGRLWEADIQGTVVSTLRLKDLIIAPATPLMGYDLEMSACAPSPSLPFNFPHLSIVNQRYLVCQSPSSLFLFHSSSYQLVAWTEALDLPEHFYCDGRQLLLLTQGGRGIKVLQFASVNTSVKTLVKLGLDQQACKMMEVHCDKVKELLSSDHTLLTACSAALASQNTSLSQQLLLLEETISTLKDHQTSSISKVAVSSEGNASDEGFGTSGESGASGEAGTSGKSSASGEGGTSGVGGASGESGTSGVGGAFGTSDKSGTSGEGGASGEIGTSGEDGSLFQNGVANKVEVEIVHEEGADTGGGGVESDKIDGPSTVRSVETFTWNTRSNDRVAADSLNDSHDNRLESDTMTSSIVQDSGDFPSGPVSNDGGMAEEEPDLDSTLISDEISLTTTIADKVETQPVTSLDPDKHSSLQATHSEAVSNEETDILVARSQSKTIPQSENHRSSFQTERSSHSTPSSSLGGSVGGGGNGQYSFSIGDTSGGVGSLSSVDSSSFHEGGSIERHRTTRQSSEHIGVWQSSNESKDEEDVIAVPVIVRSASSGSLSGKSKSKKKSRRKKTSNPQPQITQREQQQLIANHDANVLSSVSNSSPSSLVHIPEEELPFPEAGLPPSSQNSPQPSHTPSPFPSLPSTPPQSRTPPIQHHPLNPSLLLSQVQTLSEHSQEKAESAHSVQTQSQGNKDPLEKQRIQRSSSIDIVAGGVAVALKTMAQGGQRKVKDLFSSFSGQHSSSHDSAASHVTSKQPVVYRNSDVLLSSPGSVEEGEFALATSPPPSRDQISSPSESLSSPTPPPPPPPPVDPQTDEFSTATMETRESLEDPLLLCCPEDLRSVLCHWVTALENYTSHIVTHSNVADSISFLTPPPPLPPLPPSIVSSASHLAMLCAELAVYSSISDNMPPEPMVEASQSCDNHTPHISHDNSETADLQSHDHSETLDSKSYDHPVGDLVEFISRYGELLDMGRLRRLLGKQEWIVRQQAWRTLTTADYFVAFSDIALEKSQSTLTDHSMLTVLLQYPITPEDFLSNALSYFPRLMPWEVAMACGLQFDQSDSSKPIRRDLYISYLSQLLDKNESDIHREILHEIFVCDPDLLLLSLRVVLEAEDKTHTTHTTPQEKPRPGSHMTEWAEPGCLDCLVGMAVHMETERQKQSALELCQSSGYWLGVIQLQVAMGDKKNALKTILCLGDMQLLTQPQPWGVLLGDMADWRLVLECSAPPSVAASTHSTTEPASKHNTPIAVATPIGNGSLGNSDTSAETTPTNHNQKKEELHSENEIQESLSADSKEKEWLLYYMLSTLTPNAVSQLLSSCPGNFFIEEGLHSLLVAFTSLHAQQRSLAHALLEKVDRYLWSPRPSALGPHLRTTLSSEKETDAVKEAMPSPLPPLPSSSPVLLPPTLEEAGMHWGVRTSGGSDVCAICSLPLISPVSERLPGLITFICGHAFHKSCVPESACVTCFAPNGVKLLAAATLTPPSTSTHHNTA